MNEQVKKTAWRIRSLIWMLVFSLLSGAHAGKEVFTGEYFIRAYGDLLQVYTVENENINFAARYRFANDISFVLLSPLDKRLLLGIEAEAGILLKVFDLKKEKTVLKSDIVSKAVPIFWLTECSFAWLKTSTPHGGTLCTYTLPLDEVTGCSGESNFPEDLRDVPEGKSPAYLIGVGINQWAHYENGAREVVNWIGQGNFYDFQIGV